MRISPFFWGKNGPPEELKPSAMSHRIKPHEPIPFDKWDEFKHKPFVLVKQPNGDWVEEQISKIIPTSKATHAGLRSFYPK